MTGIAFSGLPRAERYRAQHLPSLDLPGFRVTLLIQVKRGCAAAPKSHRCVLIRF